MYLTVTAPKQPPSQTKYPNGYPVLFWIHGGAFEQGLGNCALYNASLFAQNDVVSVVINYRLGVLGFMASTSMSGNYGFLDQRLALQWTQRNIAAFGGDPTQVTIAGQSAGAQSASCHVSSPDSKGLFSRVIYESNPVGLPLHTKQSAEKNARSVFEYLDCTPDDVPCMRNKTVDEILDAQKNAVKLTLSTLLVNFLPFSPIVDANSTIPEQPLDAFMGGRLYAPPTATLAGTMYDEGQLFVYELFTSPLDVSAYDAILRGVFGDAAPVVKEQYPPTLVPDNTDMRNVLNYLATDLLFYCPLRNQSRSLQAVGVTAPTYVYRFKHVISFDCWGPNYTYCVGVVCHGSELPFVFGVFSSGDIQYTPTADEQLLSSDLSGAWSNFLHSGDPNNGYKAPAPYLAYDTKQDGLVVLDEPGSEDQFVVRDAFCQLWDSIGYFW